MGVELGGVQSAGGDLRLIEAAGAGDGEGEIFTLGGQGGQIGCLQAAERRGGGEAGGRIVASGTPQEIKRNPDSITGKYL